MANSWYFTRESRGRFPRAISKLIERATRAHPSVVPAFRAYRVPQPCNLDGISMNIHEENSAYRFWVQSEREWTLVVFDECQRQKKNE